MTILLLEDDRVLSETIQEALEARGFICRVAFTGVQALEESFLLKPDLYLLDVNVPGMSGMELLKELRESGDSTPTIFITSLSDEKNVLRGYESGCDDYIRKPFALAELLVRIKAVIKRAYGLQDNTVELTKNIIFNLASFELNINGEITHLSKKDGEILAFFAKNRGAIVTKDELIGAVWSERLPSDTVIRVHINEIKKAIGKDLLTNIKGVWYKLEKI